MKDSRTQAIPPRRRPRGPSVWEWRALDERLNDLLGLDPYGDETDERSGGRLRAIRQALWWLDDDPRSVQRWLGRGGDRVLRAVAKGSRPPALVLEGWGSRRRRRLRALLNVEGALDPFERYFARVEQEVFAILCDAGPDGQAPNPHAGTSLR